MGKIIPFIKKVQNELIIKDDVSNLISMKNSSIKVKIQILPEDVHMILRILIQERKEVILNYKESSLNKNKKEMKYWKTIQETMTNLIVKFKSVTQVEEVFECLNFIELDCLVGTMEEYIQEQYLLQLQLLDIDSPLVLKHIEKLYKKILPLYEEKRRDFDNDNR